MSEQRLTVKEYMHQEPVVQSFKDVLGDNNANAYITSVLIAVANSDALQKCEPASILTSAMRAATMRLSVDPGTGEAYLVPFKDKCTLVIGYKGIRQMALRTGKYRYLNVSSIYEGEEIIEDRMTGMHSLAGGRTSKTIIGWLLYFELISGFRKSFYMTVEEIHDHARKYSKTYNNEHSTWKTERTKMERKTVLRLGLSLWGYFDPHDAMLMAKVEDAQPGGEVVDAELEDYEEPEPTEPEPVKSEDQILLELGF